MMSELKEAVRELIAQSCLSLDAEKYDDFLALCSDDFHYKLIAYSPEIGSEMTWSSSGRAELQTLFADLPTHLHVPSGTLFRHVSVSSIRFAPTLNTAQVQSSVLIILTDLDGVSKFFAAARYLDDVKVQHDRPVLARRTTRLETRDIGVGTAIPL